MDLCACCVCVCVYMCWYVCGLVCVCVCICVDLYVFVFCVDLYVCYCILYRFVLVWIHVCPFLPIRFSFKYDYLLS